jgi:hypothetical protein
MWQQSIPQLLHVAPTENLDHIQAPLHVVWLTAAPTHINTNLKEIGF